MERLYILTGAGGHLGRTIAGLLRAQGARVRGLVLPEEEAPFLAEMGTEVIRGNVCEPASLRPLFEGSEGLEVVVIHAAAVIDITQHATKRAFAVNVEGTRNMVNLALERGVHRFIHISSVHAIPEAPCHRQIRETKRFSADAVEGGYAKTKAEASAYVMAAVKKRGLPGLILHPSGIMGPGDSGTNNVVEAVRSYLQGRLPACPRGGYDLVDVRDVAAAAIAAADKGRTGETYILSGRHYEFTQIFSMIRNITGKGRRCPVVPIWMARVAAPILEKRAERKKCKPLITRYSLATLASNDNFSHEKASRELGFWPRDIYETLRDTVDWLNHTRQAKKRARIRAVASR